MIVVDASAAVAVLFNYGSEAPSIRERMAQEENDLHVPHIFEIEVLNVLRRYALFREFSERRSAELLKDVTTMSITRYPHTVLLSRVWELRDNATAYDAAYIALAETLEAPLITTDSRLARVPGIRAAVEVF